MQTIQLDGRDHMLTHVLDKYCESISNHVLGVHKLIQTVREHGLRLKVGDIRAFAEQRVEVPQRALKQLRQETHIPAKQRCVLKGRSVLSNWIQTIHYILYRGTQARFRKPNSIHSGGVNIITTTMFRDPHHGDGSVVGHH